MHSAKRSQFAVRGFGIGLLMAIASGLIISCQPITTTLKGTLTVGGSPAPSGIAVSAFSDSTNTLVGTVVTGADGTYSFGSNVLPDGDYRLRFGDGSWWSGATSWSTATRVHATDDQTTVVDASIALPAASVAGTVTSPRGNPVAGATVSLYRRLDLAPVASTTTAADGTYRIDGLSAQTLVAQFTAPGKGETWYGGTVTANGATSIDLDGSGPRSGVDAILAPEALMTGSLWGGGGDMSGLGLIIYDKATGTPITGATTGAWGAFTVHGLPAGVYTIELSGSPGRFRREVVGTATGQPATGSGFTLTSGISTSVGQLQLHGVDCPVISQGVDLSGHDLHGAVLINCNFNSANLAGANLAGANLTSVNASGASLNSATLTGADLDQAFFFNTDLGNAQLSGVSTNGTNFAGSNLQGADFGGTALGSVTSGHLVGTPLGLPSSWSIDNGYLVGPTANLSGADLSNLDFTGRDLHGANFGSTNLSGVVFTSADLHNASFGWANLSGANLGGANLASSSLSWVRSGGIAGTPSALPAGWVLFSGTLFGTRATVTGANIQGADLSSADLTGVTSGGLVGTPSALPPHWALSNGFLFGSAATVTNADITGLDLSDVHLNGVTSGGLTGTPVALPAGWVLHNGYLVGLDAQLQNADLAGLVAPGIDLFGTNLSSAHLTGADLSGANLANAHLSLSDLSTANLTSADLTGADLYGANLTDTALIGSTLASIYSGSITGSPASLPAGRPIVNGFLLCPGASIPYADLSGADLSGLDLSNAHLMRATLDQVDLTNTNLSGAVLTDATLTNATVQGTDFTGADLTRLFSGSLAGTPAALPTGWILSGGVLVPPDGS